MPARRPMKEDLRIKLRGGASNDRSACGGKNPGGARGKSCRIYGRPAESKDGAPLRRTPLRGAVSGKCKDLDPRGAFPKPKAEYPPADLRTEGRPRSDSTCTPSNPECPTRGLECCTAPLLLTYRRSNPKIKHSGAVWRTVCGHPGALGRYSAVSRPAHSEPFGGFAPSTVLPAYPGVLGHLAPSTATLWILCIHDGRRDTRSLRFQRRKVSILVR